jgi:UDP-glucose 4-epimerase
MRILVTGGNGSVGQGLIPHLLARGHHVVVLDTALGAVRAIAHPRFSMVAGGVEDAAAVAGATRGVEAILHLAWSFSDDPLHLLEHDLRGHALLLGAAREQGVRHFIYASTAVVYGKPVRAPMDEEHPLRVLEARKPAYGMAKEFAEKLTLLAAKETALSATVLRFWWAFGDEIGGRHLRDMLKTAASGDPVRVPADCGGSFLSQDDFNQAVEAILSIPATGGRVFNLASAYVTWEEVARMVVKVTGGKGGIEVIPREAWTGAAFLADRWELADQRVRTAVGFSPTRGTVEVRDALTRAIAETWERLRSRDAASRTR